MSERCVKCGEALAAPLPAVCPACGETVAGTAITETPMLAGARPVPTSEPPEADGPRSIVKPEAKGPPCPGWLLAGLSGVLCGGQGAMMGFGKSGKFDYRSDEAYIGAGIGLAIGLVLAVDHWRFQKELDRMRAVADDGTRVASAAPPGETIPIVMLILPVVAGFVMWFGTSLDLSEAVIQVVGSVATVGTAVLGYFSIRQMAFFAQRSKAHTGTLSSPAFMYLAMLALWLVCFPVHFLIRSRMGGRNLLIPGLVVTGVYCLPIFQPFFVEAELPSVTNGEVQSLVKQLLEQNAGLGRVTVKNPAEVSFNKELQKRVGRCTIASKKFEEEFTFTITWQNRGTGVWQVTVLPQLPAVDSPEVINLIQNNLMLANGGRPTTLRDPVQVSFDTDKQIRAGRVTAVSPAGNTEIRFNVIWDNRTNGTFRVHIPPP